VRRIAPPDTLGGGVVLDPAARKHGPGRDALARLERLARGEADAPGTRPEADLPPLRASTRPVSPSRPTADLLTPSQLTLEERLRRAGVEPPLDSELDAGDLAALRAAGRAVRVSRSLHYHPDALTQVRARVIALAQRGEGSITLAQVRDELGTSRKFAQALLEHLDSERVTIRRGEERRLRGAAATKA
jgi:selenocysteine-specific elongation factor